MALVKVINDGDEIVFDLEHMDPQAVKRISIVMVKRSRPANVMEIRADRSIPIRHIKKEMVVTSEETTTARDTGNVVDEGIYEFTET
jgi:hypothetical protein